jgi:rubrerythrin
MNTEMLKKEFEEILSFEKNAEIAYDDYIAKVDDEEIKEKLISIRDDEIRHIKIAETLIECLS